MLQQVVLLRPAMILPLEEIVTGIVTNLRVSVMAQLCVRQDALRSGRMPLPPVALSELPAMLALLEAPTANRGAVKKRARPKRR